MTVASTAKRRRRQLKLTNKSKTRSTNAKRAYQDAKISLSGGKRKR